MIKKRKFFLNFHENYDTITKGDIMSFDGVFIHHLINEVREQITNQRINKVFLIDFQNFILNLSNRKNLLLCLNSDNSHFRFTTEDYLHSNKVNPFYITLKKYLASSVIVDIKQIANDRIVDISIDSYNELGYSQRIHLILELFGRNSNFYITDSIYQIIDCYKKNILLSENTSRVLLPKMTYTNPTTDRINPFTTKVIYNENKYLGVSNLLYAEIIYQNNLEIINKKTEPQIITTSQKIYFYCFDLEHLQGEVTYFPSLSELLEYYYLNNRNLIIQSAEQKQVENYLKREIIKVQNKIQKQEQEKREAVLNLDLERIGNLLSTNLYRVSKNSSQITVLDFYNNNQEIVIPLNPLLSPAKNLDNIFSKYKKAKRTLIYVEEQIKASINELQYLETLKEQFLISKASDLKEIIEELGLNKKNNQPKKKTKPQITKYYDAMGNLIMVGKNNIQNNYLTHTLANKNDYFFHVKNAPGSHTILRTKSLTEEAIILASHIAAIYSKNKYSSNVAVDYTLVKNVRKVPKTKGSFVTYTNYQTSYVTPDIDYITKHTTLNDK